MESYTEKMRLMMGSSAPDTVEELIYYFVEKKRLSIKDYRYMASIKWDKYFEEAAELCQQHQLTPQAYIQKMYDRMEDRKQFFSPEHIRGGNVAKFLSLLGKENDSTYVVEITNDNIEYADVWRQQTDLAMRYIRRGESVESVLLDSSLKFFGWYRILSTPKPYPNIIDKYNEIAKKEMNPRLRAFLLQENLDVDRIQ